MKAVIYIEKDDFDRFFKWMYYLKCGIYIKPPVKFYSQKEDVSNYLQLNLEDFEYSILQMVTKEYLKIEKQFGQLDTEYSLDTKPNDLLAITDVLNHAELKDSVPEVVYTAITIASEIPGLTPLEIIAIAERDCLFK